MMTPKKLEEIRKHLSFPCTCRGFEICPTCQTSIDEAKNLLNEIDQLIFRLEKPHAVKHPAITIKQFMHALEIREKHFTLAIEVLEYYARYSEHPERAKDALQKIKELGEP